MAYILSAPNDTAPVITIQSFDEDGVLTGNVLTIPSLQEVTINNSLDTYQWEQLNAAGKFTVPTTSTNSIQTTLVVDPELFFGNVTSPNAGAKYDGLFKVGVNKTLCNVTVNMGNVSAGGTTVYGSGYVTGLAPTVTASEPVWTTPVTFSITGDINFS